ncbi:hypothetical protein FHS96_000334 [Sphingomonas zeicaulis]|uniref:alpha/beta hydrolase n=1 Tax=Sphingomonas zeicaulis TaxID=1632740 RepID=UPI003D24761C
MSENPRSVSFRNGDLDLAGALHLPPGFDAGRRYPALVIATPGSSVKEQIGAVYGRKLAAHGFVVLVFDPAYQGQSGGFPRDREDPATRIEDIRCGADHLVTLPFVAEDRIGLLGICAGGGYAVSAAMIDRRFKALGTVVASNIGRAFRQNENTPNAVEDVLEAVARQRTAEARGAAVRRDNWLPDTPEDAAAAGITDRDMLDAIDFYRTPRGRNPHSTNRLHFESMSRILGFDGFHLAEQLLVQPVLVVVGGRIGTTFSYADGKQLYEQARNRRGFVAVEGAGHYDLYDKDEYVDQAVAALAPFFKQQLGA